MRNKVTIEEPEERSEGPEWVVGGMYESVSGVHVGSVYIADMHDTLVNLKTGKVWSEGKRFAGDAEWFRRLPTGTKVTIEVQP